MSSLLVKVRKIDNIEKHPNADTLSILTIGGWNVVAKTEGIAGAKEVLYIPIDAVADKDHPFLNFLDGKRVKTAKVRGLISQGLCIPVCEVIHYLKHKKNLSFAEIGDLINPLFENNLAELLDIRKYEPPVDPVSFCGQEAAPDGRISKYTDIENYNNYVDILKYQIVSVTSKLHGTSARYYLTVDELTGETSVGIAGRNLHFKYPQPENTRSNVYIDCFEFQQIKEKLEFLRRTVFCDADTICFYGEIVGPGVQGKNFKYGLQKPTFFLYDISINDRYLDFDSYKSIAYTLDMFCCPILESNVTFHSGLLDLASGKENELLGGNLREGIVIKPVIEQRNPKLGRVILKVISKEYLLKDGTDNKNL